MIEAEAFLDTLGTELANPSASQQSLTLRLREDLAPGEPTPKRLRAYYSPERIEIESDDDTSISDHPFGRGEVEVIAISSSPSPSRPQTPKERYVSRKLLEEEQYDRTVGCLFRNKDNVWVNIRTLRTALDLWNVVDEEGKDPFASNQDISIWAFEENEEITLSD